MTAVLGWYAARRRRISPASWIALCPFHGRALWLAMPFVVISARRVPLHPPSTSPSVGSRGPRRRRRRSGPALLLDVEETVELAVDLLSLVEDEGEVDDRLPDLLRDAQLGGDATLHVDSAPTPQHVDAAGIHPPRGQVGRLGGQGNGVDVRRERPARRGRGRCARRGCCRSGDRQVVQLGQGSLDRVGDRRFTLLTDSMSQRAAVRVTTSSVRSRAESARGIRSLYGRFGPRKVRAVPLPP